MGRGVFLSKAGAAASLVEWMQDKSGHGPDRKFYGGKRSVKGRQVKLRTPGAKGWMGWRIAQV